MGCVEDLVGRVDDVDDMILKEVADPYVRVGGTVL